MSFTVQDLAGRWVTDGPQAAPAPDGDTNYATWSFTFDQDAYELRLTTYADPAASVPLFSLRGVGTLLLGAELDDPAGAREADFQASARFVTPHNAGIVAAFGGAGSGWQADVERDISHTGVGPFPSVDDASTEHDLLKVDGDRLWFGEHSLDMLKPENRPTRLHLPLKRA